MQKKNPRKTKITHQSLNCTSLIIYLHCAQQINSEISSDGVCGFFSHFFLFYCIRESWWAHCPWIIFSQICFTFFIIYPSRLRFFVNLFFNCGLLCLFFIVVFFSTRCCQYYMNYWTHIHRSIVGKIDPTSEDVKSKLCSGRHGIYWGGLAWNKWHF
jgi:hypothetical protein